MTVYVEDVLIENFLVTYLTLSIVYGFLKQEKPKIRVIIACILASLVALIYPLLILSSLLLFLLKILIGYIICLIAYKGETLKKQAFFVCMFLIVTSIYGGINLCIYFALYGNFESTKKLPTILIVFSLYVITYFLKQCQQKLYQKKNISNFIYNIEIKNDNEIIKTIAYLDTGNILQDNKTQKPVVLVNYKMFEKINKNFKVQTLLTKSLSGLKNAHYITVKTATNSTELLAFCVDELKIYESGTFKVFKMPVFALSKVKITGFDCDVILNSKLLGDWYVFKIIKQNKVTTQTKFIRRSR